MTAFSSLSYISDPTAFSSQVVTKLGGQILSLRRFLSFESVFRHVEADWYRKSRDRWGLVDHIFRGGMALCRSATKSISLEQLKVGED